VQFIPKHVPALLASSCLALPTHEKQETSRLAYLKQQQQAVVLQHQGPDREPRHWLAPRFCLLPWLHSTQGHLSSADGEPPFLVHTPKAGHIHACSKQGASTTVQPLSRSSQGYEAATQVSMSAGNNIGTNVDDGAIQLRQQSTECCARAWNVRLDQLLYSSSFVSHI
jgi:hypothetical protein